MCVYNWGESCEAPDLWTVDACQHFVNMCVLWERNTCNMCMSRPIAGYYKKWEKWRQPSNGNHIKDSILLFCKFRYKFNRWTQDGCEVRSWRLDAIVTSSGVAHSAVKNKNYFVISADKNVIWNEFFCNNARATYCLAQFRLRVRSLHVQKQTKWRVEKISTFLQGWPCKASLNIRGHKISHCRDSLFLKTLRQ